MRRGIFLQVTDGERVLPVAAVAERIRLAEELGFDSAWVMDHLFVERDGRRVTGHDPFLLLAYAAAVTNRVRLGTLVAATAFRPPGQLAREAAALADASRGRFVLGLGSGWHQPAFDAFDLPFDHRVGRFEERARAVSRLLRGGRVSSDGEYVTLREAETLASAGPPPIWIAARGPRMLRVTAELADGWNLAWGGPDPAWLAEPLAGLRAALARAGRDRASFTISAGMLCIPAADPGPLREAAAAYEAAGVDELIVCLGDGPLAPLQPGLVETAAAALL